MTRASRHPGDVASRVLQEYGGRTTTDQKSTTTTTTKKKKPPRNKQTTTFETGAHHRAKATHQPPLINATDQFHDEKELGGRLVDLKEAHHVGVLDPRQNVDFPLEHLGLFADAALVDDFEGVALAIFLAHAAPHNRKGPGAHGLLRGRGFCGSHTIDTDDGTGKGGGEVAGPFRDQSPLP